MPKSTLIIIAGLAATGKTTLSRKLASQTGLPLLSKDTIKETLFDSIGHGDCDWGEMLNQPTYDVLDQLVEQRLGAGDSLILDTPYDLDFRGDKYVELQNRYGFSCVQVLCHAEPEVLIQRYTGRIGTPERHPGHNDDCGVEAYTRRVMTSSKVDALPLLGKVFEIDTTTFCEDGEKELVRHINEYLAEPQRNTFRPLRNMRFRTVKSPERHVLIPCK